MARKYYALYISMALILVSNLGSTQANSVTRQQNSQNSSTRSAVKTLNVTNQEQAVSQVNQIVVNLPQPRSSNYRLLDNAVNAGAGDITSTNYVAHATVGQIAGGDRVSSTHYVFSTGYEAGSGAIPIIGPYFLYMPMVLMRWPPLPDAPVLAAITAPGASPTYTMSWSSPLNSSSYVLQEAIDSAFLTSVIRYSGIATRKTITSSNTAAFYYRVKASNQYGDSSWSNVQAVNVSWELEPNNFYTQSTPLITSGQNVYGFPNDTKDYFSFNMTTSGPITADLTGSTGSAVQLQLFYQVATEANRVTYVAAPPYHLTYSGQPGTYYVYIGTGSGFNGTTPYTLRVFYPASAVMNKVMP